jgi:hypothetical protein
MSAPYINYIERDLDEKQCPHCEVPESWCRCRGGEDMPLRWEAPSDDATIGAVDSWLRAADDAEGRSLGEPFDVEERKALDWRDLESEARGFKERYGAAAMLRCVSDALR